MATYRGLRLSMAAVLVLFGFAMLNAQSASARGDGVEVLHLVAVGVCPPYRKKIPVAVCRESAKLVSDGLSKRLNIAKENVFTLFDEASTAQNVLKTLAEVNAKADADDRVIVYLQLHGDAFHLWSDYYRPSAAIVSASRTIVSPSEDILVFWTREEPTIPAIALAQSDWMTAQAMADALDGFDAKVSLLLDSCSSGLFFRSLANASFQSDNIDFVATSSGADQSSLFDEALTVTLFAREISDSIDLPTIRTFGEALDQARITTALAATAQCMKMDIHPQDYHYLYPNLPVPSEIGADGKVNLPMWSCAQVPNVVDLTGETSALPIH